jgi:diguanylate cyclase (GGDEF)-like protein
MEGTGTGWVINQKKSFIESDLSKDKYFSTGETFSQLGLKTVAYLPLIAKGRAIGSFIIASHRSDAYAQRHIKLLEQLASQIAMPLENSQLYAQAEKKARIDELTGLLNRRSLDEMIDNEISRHSRYGGSFTLAILDLDSFKAYNDNYGHPAGDRLLKQVGHGIASAIRNVDHAFRYGGDEFAILLPQTNIDESLQVTERVRRKITDGLDSGDIPVSASIGLASWPDDGISHTDIIAAADATLYRAKRSGGNKSYCASATMTPFQISDSIIDSKASVDEYFIYIVHALSETADSRSFHTNNHSQRVTDCSLALGKSLMLAEQEMTKLEICSLLHDIGKICIKDTILNKPNELSAEEWEMVKVHPTIGADIVKRIPHLAQYADGILYHHEWYDGSGYPDGLKGEDIPLEARIVAIADAFATMTTERSYSEMLTHEHAIEELKRCAGIQFDPFLVEKFISIYETKITGINKKARR